MANDRKFLFSKSSEVVHVLFSRKSEFVQNLIIHRAVLTCSLTLNNDFTLWSISFLRLLLSKLFRIFIRYVTSLFGNRTIGKNLAINWPPRSPDLSTLDFFLWGYVKELTFQEPPKTIPELKLKITESFEVVRQNTAMLRRVQGALVRRSELVVNQQGKHFEHKVSKKTVFCS